MKTIVWLGLVLGALSATGDVIIAKVGENSRLICGGGNYRKTLMWYHKNELIQGYGSNGLPIKGSTDITKRSQLRNMRLDISGLKEEDGGTFRCNADGADRSEHTLVVISVSVTPSGNLQVGSEATLHSKVSGVDQSTVEWIGPDGHSHKESQVVLKSVAASDGGTWNCKITYGGNVIHTESLNIVIKEATPATTKPTIKSNSKGPSDVHKPTCMTCNPDTPLSDDMVLLGLIWWVWVAIGVGAIVVILLIICVIVKCIRIRRKQKKYLKMKQTQQEMKTRKYCQCNRPTAAAKPPQQGRRREKPSALPL